VIPTSLRSLLPHTELSVAVSDLCESYPLRSGRANLGARLRLLFIRTRRAHRGAAEKLVSAQRRSSRGVAATNTNGAPRYVGRSRYNTGCAFTASPPSPTVR